MRLKKLALFQIVLLLLMVVATQSFALAKDLPTLTLNKTSITTGADVIASGVSEPGAWVPLKVVDSEKNIVVFDVAKADGNGAYSINFIVPPNASGALTVVVGEGNRVATGSIIIKGKDSGDPGGSNGSGGSSGGDKEIESDTEVSTDPGGEEPVEIPTDITGHWAEADIKILIGKDVITGYPDRTFRPNNNITRAEFATIVVKAFNLEAKTGKIFDDTTEHWASEAIAIAQAHDVVNGYSETIFGPDDNITREQMAVMIFKAAKISETAEGKTFADSDQISAWARSAVDSASENGIITGYPDQTFRPQGQATRAEAATVVVKALR